ncbi:MAG: endolytic transglycosylase MltG [Gammaproteobacteria bacterium]|nr:endolytic transglycosylase MltG [Gammaproteobacteria bacterium]
MRIAGLIILLVLFGGAAAWLWVQREMDRQANAPLRIEQEDTIEVPEGARLDDVIVLFKDRGLSAEGWWIRRFAIREGIDRRLQSGEYRMLPGDSARSLFERMVRGDVIRRRLTIVEGWTVAQMLNELRSATLRQTEGLSPSNLSAALCIDKTNPEGLFLPDTYDYTRRDKDVDVLRRAYDAMQEALQAAWASRQPNLPYQDAYAALIVASMIEKETGIGSDRPLIASVFAGRLRAGMKMQSDPTVIYGLGAAFDGNLTRLHLNTPNPYNTYTITSLPPTPIALPGQESLRATFNHPELGYLYFVGRGDGSSQFSATLREHNKAVDTYQRRRRP